MALALAIAMPSRVRSRSRSTSTRPAPGPPQSELTTSLVIRRAATRPPVLHESEATHRRPDRTPRARRSCPTDRRHARTTGRTELATAGTSAIAAGPGRPRGVVRHDRDTPHPPAPPPPTMAGAGHHTRTGSSPAMAEAATDPWSRSSPSRWRCWTTACPPAPNPPPSGSIPTLALVAYLTGATATEAAANHTTCQPGAPR